jgi:putative hydrolase of HD superfamily
MTLDAEGFLAFMHFLEMLKNTTRHSWTSENRHESVAEHSWRLAVMALLLKPYYPDLDFDRVPTMALLHDPGEARNGDIPDFNKTENDAAEEDREIVRLLEDQRSFCGIIA